MYELCLISRNRQSQVLGAKLPVSSAGVDSFSIVRHMLAALEEFAMFSRAISFTVLAAAIIFVGHTIPGRANTLAQTPPVVPPHLTKLAKPDCSAGKSCHRVHGVVVVTVDVLTDGTVGDANIKSGDNQLAEDALKAAKQCRFTPGTLKGKPTSMNYDLEYKF
jgi:TonB family protein